MKWALYSHYHWGFIQFIPENIRGSLSPGRRSGRGRRDSGRAEPTGEGCGDAQGWCLKNHAVFAKCCACFLELARHLAYVSKPFLATSAAWTSPTEDETRSYSAVARKRLQCSGLSVPFSSRVFATTSTFAMERPAPRANSMISARLFEVVVGLMKVIHTQLMQPCQRLQDCQLQQKHRTCQVASNFCCSWFSHSRCRTSCYSNRWMCSGSKHRHPRHTTIQKTCSALSILRSNLFWRSGPVTIAMLCNSMSHKPICSRSIKTLQCLVNFTSSSKMKAPEVGSGLRLSKPTPRSWPQLRLCLKKVRGTCTELTLQVRSTLRQHSERWDVGMLRNARALCLLTSDSAQLSLRTKSTQQSNSFFLKIVFFVGSRSMAIWWARRPRLGCKNNLRCLLNWSSEQSIRRPCPSRRRTRNPNRRERMNLQKLKPSSGLWTSISF